MDRSLIKAASWRLASELVRRHATALRLSRGHPGGGQSDCLWLLPLVGEEGDINGGHGGGHRREVIAAIGFGRCRPGAWELRVHASRDPVTSRKRYLSRAVRGGKREANPVLAAMIVEPNEHGAPRWGTLAELLEESRLTYTTPRDTNARREFSS